MRETDSIGRMITIHPNQSEKFFLRLLLKHTTGSRSFSDLRSYRETTYSTYKAACVARELLEDDSQWIACLTEAVQIATPKKIRSLFCNIVVHCHPTDPKEL